MAERRKCYKILGLEYGATEDEVRKAYKKLALQFHPDKNDSESAKEKFQEIGYAYKYLTEGPNSISTSDPHDLREEFLRKLFEDLFLPRFHGHNFFGGGGGFAFFFADDNDDADDDNYDYYGGFHHHSDSSDSNSYRSRPSSSHYNRGSSQTWSSSIYHQTSAKQQKRKEKKQRQKERAKEKKRKEREESTKSESVYTDDIATDNNQTESSSRKQSLTSNNEENKNSTKPNQQTKLNKKEKKKLESEQRKREKEMEEIAEELMKKEAQDLEKMKEKEKQAAKKLEEEEESSFIPQFYAQKEKKSRKARQREKKRQEAAELQERIDNARNVSSSSASASSVYTQNTQTNITSSSSGKHNGTTKPSTQSKQTPLSTRHSSVKVEKGRQNLTQKKAGVMGSRFDVLENLIDSDVGSSDDHETFVGETLTFSHDYRSDNKDYDDENEDDDDDDNDDDDENGDNDDIEDDDESDNVEKIDKDRKASNFNERGNSELHDFKTRPNSHEYKQVSSGYNNDYYHDNLYTGYGGSRGFTPSFASRNGFVRQGFHGPNIHPRFPAPNNYQYSRGPPPPPPPQSRFHDPNIHPRSLDPNNFQYFRGTPPPPPPQSRYPIHSYENMRPPYPNPGYGYPDPRYGYPHNQPFRYNSSYHTSSPPHRDREFSGKRNTSYSDVPYNSKFAPSDEKRNFDTHIAYSQFNRKFESDTKIGGKKSQYSGGYKTNETFSATSKNLFQTCDDINQVPSSTKDVFDSLDDIEDSSEFKNPVVKERLSNWSDIDDGYDQLLSSDKLGVPKGMFNDKIKNYYK
ncbi:hypothetical protein ACF0H5_022813 [Mactra antiquata]